MVVRSVVRSPVRNVVQSVFGASEAFNPFQLFTSGAQGAWYDPSDFSTLYQDAAGTTPVTAVEQPVRLMLDRSKGLVLGSELVTNGDFSDGTTTGWTAVTTTLSVVSGELKVVNDSAGVGQANQAITTVVGRLYKILASMRSDATNVTADSCRLVIGTSPTVSYFVTANGVQRNVEAFFIATSTSTNLGFQIASSGAAGASGDTIYIDNVSVRELPGNHAVAPNDASRPVLRARYNLLTRTEDWSVAPWANVSGGTASLPTLTPNAGVAPDGTTTATRIQFALNGGTTTGDNVRRRQVITPPAGNNTFSFYVRSFDGVSTYTMLYEDTSGFINSLTVTGDWQRVVKATNYVAVNTGLGLGIRGGQTPTNSDSADVLVWGAQLLTAADQAATGGAYQRIAAATDYDTSNPVWRPYLAFDGSDDSLSTSAIDFSGTDKMTVFAGVTKLSDAAAGVVLGHGADFAAVGAFEWQANTGANATTAFRGRSSAGSTANAGFFLNVTAPSTFVFASLVDYAAAAGAEFSGRYNGVVQVQNDGLLQENTGTFGNNVLTIGSRQGGASQRFNGRLYGLTVLGRTATAPELTAMESWIAGKTGVSL